MKSFQYLILISTTLIMAGCGGGSSDPQINQPIASSAAIMYVNKDGLYKTAPISTSTNYVKNDTSGYFITAYASSEWSGFNLKYTDGYVNPTSGTLMNFKVSDRISSELWWGFSNLNYDISKTKPSVDSSVLPFEAFADAKETKIYGGNNNDITYFLFSTTEVDLGSGIDTLKFSQNFSIYKFEKVAGSSTSIYASRDGSKSLVKNVEIFEFADGKKTLNEIISSLP